MFCQYPLYDMFDRCVHFGIELYPQQPRILHVLVYSIRNQIRRQVKRFKYVLVMYSTTLRTVLHQFISIKP